MEKITESMGMNAAQLTKYALIFGCMMVMLGVGNTYITCLIGAVYPCYKSFEALETEGEEDDK